MSALTELMEQLALAPVVLVEVVECKGSVPREPGAWMAVWPHGQTGTIGGGHLEWQAIERARGLWPLPNAEPELQTVVLGPSLGQCCGGQVSLRYQRWGPADRDVVARRLQSRHTPVALFGGGHVGRAIVNALLPLPFDIHWIDSRDEVFPAGLPPQVLAEHSDPVQAAVSDLRPGAQVLIMSFSHAEDLDVVAACLLRQRERGDLPFVGLIGSRTKWATFRHRLEARGFSAGELAHITCPIGLPGLKGKAPEVIAASVAAQLLLTLSGSDCSSAEHEVLV